MCTPQKSGNASLNVGQCRGPEPGGGVCGPHRTLNGEHVPSVANSQSGQITTVSAHENSAFQWTFRLTRPNFGAEQNEALTGPSF